MNLLVREIMHIGRLKDATVFAGASGLDNEVSLVTVMDVPNITNWLHGGEMLLVASLFSYFSNRDFLLALQAKSVSAIVTKPAYVKDYPQELIDLYDEIHLPVLLVAQDTTWGEITEPLIELIARKQYEAIYQSQQFHNALMQSMLRRDSLDTLCQNIYETGHLNVATISPDNRIMGRSRELDWDKALDGYSRQNTHRQEFLAAATETLSRSGIIFSNSFLNQQGLKLFIYPIMQNQVLYGSILLAVNQEQKMLNTADSMKLQQLSLLAALEISREEEIKSSMRRFHNLLFDDILSNSFKTELDKKQAERILGHSFYSAYSIALIKSQVPSKQNLYYQRHQISLLFETLCNNPMFPNILCFEKSSYLVFFLPDNGTKIDPLIQNLLTVCKRFLHYRSLRIGVSDPMPFTRLSRAFQQAIQALHYANAHKGAAICHYQDLGILRYFIDHSGNLDEEFLQETIDRYLKPLRDYDALHHSQLEHTITLFLSNKLSHSKTGDELYIHKNTLRFRLNKIEELLGCDLKNQEDLFHIHLAIKIDYYKKLNLK